MVVLTIFLVQFQAHGKSSIHKTCYDRHGNQLILLQDDQADGVDFRIILNYPKVSLTALLVQTQFIILFQMISSKN